MAMASGMLATGKRSRRGQLGEGGGVSPPVMPETGGNGQAASRAEHFHRYAVPVECEAFVRCVLYAAQDADGKWFASDGLQIGGDEVRKSVLTPYTAPKFESEAAALRAAAGELERWLALEAGEYRDVAPAIGQAVHEWTEEVHKHVTANQLAEAKAKRGAGKPAAELRPTSHEARTIVKLPLDKIHRHPHNRAVSPPTCQGLAESLQRRGQLQPVRVRPVENPVGHYQLVDGERRYWAAQIAGWDQLDAEVVPMDDAQAEAEIAAANGQRQELNDIERADRLAWLQKPVEAGGAGLTQTAAAAEMGIAQPTASLLQKVARLPACWREAVIAGEMAASWLRPVADYADCPAILDLLWADYRQACKQNFQADTWGSRAAIEQTVFGVIQNDTRPLTRADKVDDREWNTPVFDAAALDAGQLKSLGVVTIRSETGQEIRRCTKVKAWQKLQERARKEQTPLQREHQKTPAKAGTTNAKPKRTPAEQRKLDAEADRQLADRIQGRGGLAEIALRIDLAGQLKEGGYVTRLLHDDLVATSRENSWSSTLDYHGWKYLAERLLIADRLPKGKSSPSLSGADPAAYARFSAAAIDWDGDPETDCDRRQLYVCRLLLWPYSEVILAQGKLAKRGEWPERFPRLEAVVLDLYAVMVGASIRNTWVAARDNKGPARLWLLEFVRTYRTARQRQGLCSELGVVWSPGDKLSELEDAILAQHAERGLKLPAVLEKQKKGKPGRAGRR